MKLSSCQTAIRLLLLLASIHMLGSCPCGCLEENGWYQTAISLLDHQGSTSDQKIPSGEDDCDEELKPSYILTKVNRDYFGIAHEYALLPSVGNSPQLFAVNDSTKQNLACRNSDDSLVLRTQVAILRL